MNNIHKITPLLHQREKQYNYEYSVQLRIDKLAVQHPKTVLDISNYYVNGHERINTALIDKILYSLGKCGIQMIKTKEPS